MANTIFCCSDFYKWNPAVNNGGECAGLWPNYWVCIGLQ